MATFIQDLRFALRTLRKSPGFALVAVLTLALGIGANSAIFSVVNGMLLRPLPYPDAHQLVRVWADWEKRNGPKREWTNPADFHDWRSQGTLFTEMYFVSGWAATLTGDGEPELLNGAVVSHGMFATLGVQPALGRGFTESEDKPNAPGVFVISDSLWKRRFGGDKNVLGRTVKLNDGITYTIIGVMPPSFRFPDPPTTEVWTPAQFAATNRGNAYLRVIGRLKPGVTLVQAQAEMNTVAARLEQQYPATNKSIGIALIPLQEDLAGPARTALLVLLGAVGFVLLIACANVANLLLARATARQREIAIRIALGAGRGRLLRQLLTESLLLSAAGGLLGLLLAVWAANWLAASAPGGFSGTFQLGVDRWVIGFTLLLAVGTGFIFGLAPALQATRPASTDALKKGGRGVASGQHRMRSALVIAELALSLVLLVGAGLLLKSFYTLLRVSPGFNPNNVLTAELILPQVKYREGAHAQQFYTQLIENVRRMPGVLSAAAINNLPLGDNNTDTSFLIEGRPAPQPDQFPTAWLTPVTPGYFSTMGIPLVRGRVLDERDHAQAPLVIVINESMAKQYWPGEEPIGRRIGTGQRSPQGPTWWEVVGVVSNVRQFGLDRDEPPAFYLSHAQRTSRRMNLVVRTAGDPLALAPAVRSAVWAQDRDLAIPSIITMEKLIAQSVADRRFTMALLGAFATLAMALAAIGIYGVMAYNVTQRTHEIGIRMALGAQRGHVLRMVIGQGMTLAGIGVGLGLLGALALSGFLEKLLFGIATRDALTFAAVPLAMAGVALLACWIPARRAMRVDPMVALRYE